MAQKLPDEVLELRGEAVMHKRLSASHRRLARQRMERLRAMCTDLGIDFEEVTRKDGDEGHGPREDSTTD